MDKPIRFIAAPQNRGELALMSCTSGRPLAERIIKNLNKIINKDHPETELALVKTDEITFANGEIKTIIKDNIRGADLYIVQSVDDPLSNKSINDNLMAVLTAINAAYQSDADSITVIMPQYPYSRQERKKAREGLTAKQVASFLEISGADRVITLDIHSEAIQGFFNTAKLEDLHASNTLIRYFKKHFPTEDLVVAAADVGGAEKARYYSNRLHTDMVVVDKARDYSRTSIIESMRLVGNVKNKNVLIPDDMISTGGTMVNAAKLLRHHGANQIYVAASLPFFNEPALELLQTAYDKGEITSVIGTDAVYWGDEFVKNTPWYHEVSISSLFAQVIYNINTKQSVSQLLK
ncbi:MAG: ribose-phosphate pyrophosphokinase [Calditrichales bacterium]|nr:MAG: ribose-phosphate pyrophosphokinase [Calditrichales bacterium]